MPNDTVHMKKIKHSDCRVAEPTGALSLNLILENLNMATTGFLNLRLDRQPGSACASGVR